MLSEATLLDEKQPNILMVLGKFTGGVTKDLW